MAFKIGLEVNVFNALFFLLHEFFFLAIIHLLVDSFVNRKIREKIAKGKDVCIRRTGFFHVYSTGTRTWAAVVALILMLAIWVSVPLTELGISSDIRFETKTAPLIHIRYGDASPNRELTFRELVDQNPDDPKLVAYDLSAFFYSASKCTIPVLTAIGENIGKEFFDLYLDPVRVEDFDKTGAIAFNELINASDRAAPETACRNGEGGRDRFRLAKIYQVPINDFGTKRFFPEPDEAGQILIKGEWNSTHTVHTLALEASDTLGAGGVCLRDDRDNAILVGTNTAQIYLTPENGENGLEIRKGLQSQGYRIVTDLNSTLVCETLGVGILTSLLNTPDEIYGRIAYPLSTLELDDALVTVNRQDVTKIQVWAAFVYFVPLVVAFLVCIVALLCSGRSAERVAKEVTAYSGIARLLRQQSSRHIEDGLTSDPNGSRAEMENTLPVEVKEEGNHLFLTSALKSSPDLDWRSWRSGDKL